MGGTPALYAAVDWFVLQRWTPPPQGNGAGSLIGRCAVAIAACYALDTYNSPSDAPDYAIASLRRNSCSRLIAQEDMCTQLTPRALAGQRYAG